MHIFARAVVVLVFAVIWIAAYLAGAAPESLPPG